MRMDETPQSETTERSGMSREELRDALVEVLDRLGTEVREAISKDDPSAAVECLTELMAARELLDELNRLEAVSITAD